MPRIKSLDSLKGAAVFGVICIHAVQPGVNPGLLWEVFDQICRFAVPCFFLISGFFFMGSWQRSDDRLALIRSYCLRIAAPFLFWSFFYAVVPPFEGGSPLGVRDEIVTHLQAFLHRPHTLLLSGFTYHLWFLSSLIQAAIIIGFFLYFKRLKTALLVGLCFYLIALLGGSYRETGLGLPLHDAKYGPLVSTLFFALGAWIAEKKLTHSLHLGTALIVGGLILQLSEAALLNHSFGRALSNNDFLVGTIPYATGMLLVALSRPNFDSVLSRFGRRSLGIFVSHLYLIVVLMLLPWGKALAPYPLALAVCILVAAYALIGWLGRIPGMPEWVVGRS